MRSPMAVPILARRPERKTPRGRFSSGKSPRGSLAESIQLFMRGRPSPGAGDSSPSARLGMTLGKPSELLQIVDWFVEGTGTEGDCELIAQFFEVSCQHGVAAPGGGVVVEL